MENRNPDILVAYAAGRLDPAAASALEQHIAGCAACRETSRAQGALWKVLDAWEAPDFSMDFDRRLYQRIESEVRFSWWERLARRLQWLPLREVLPITAVAGLLLAAGLIMYDPGKVAVAPHRSETVRADQVERTLDDIELLRQFSAATSAESGHTDAM